ncbi:MAG TPA: transporter, partial [bacterium]|nr:transporter [bacterium]
MLGFLAAVPVLAWAGPPFETDDPEPTDPGRLEIFLAAFAATEPSGSAGGGPQLQLNYGAAKDLQLSMAPQFSFSAPGPGPATYGLGDMQLGAKIRFLHEESSCPQAAVFPQVVLPSGDAKRGLGSGVVQVLLPLWLQKSWGPWTSFGGGGYWI